MTNTPLRLLLIGTVCILSIQKSGKVPDAFLTALIQITLASMGVAACIVLLIYIKNLVQVRCFYQAYQRCLYQFSAIREDILS